MVEIRAVQITGQLRGEGSVKALHLSTANAILSRHVPAAPRYSGVIGVARQHLLRQGLLVTEREKEASWRSADSQHRLTPRGH